MKTVVVRGISDKERKRRNLHIVTGDKDHPNWVCLHMCEPNEGDGPDINDDTGQRMWVRVDDWDKTLAELTSDSAT